MILEIPTDRLLLVPLTSAHANRMFDLLQDERLYEYISADPPRSLTTLQTRYSNLENRTSPQGTEYWFNWVLVDRSSENLLGYVQATIPVNCVFASVAYVLWYEAWGNGYATEALGHMMDWLHEALSVPEFRATVDVRNQRSIKVLERCGFRPVRYVTLNIGRTSHRRFKSKQPRADGPWLTSF